MGQIIFSIGIIMALITAAKLPAPNEAAWPTSLPWYGLAVGITLVGLWLWHRAQSSLEKKYHSATFANSATIAKTNLVELLIKLETEINKFYRDLKSLESQVIITRVESILQLYLWPVVTQQGQFIHWLDRTQTLHIILTVAETERLLNRIWSATTDGYLEEVYRLGPQLIDIWKEGAVTNLTGVKS